MASADEEEDGPEQVEEPEFRSNTQGNISKSGGKTEAFRVYEEDKAKGNVNFQKSKDEIKTKL